KTGPGDSNRIIKATMTKRGDNNNKAIPETTISKIRFPKGILNSSKVGAALPLLEVPGYRKKKSRRNLRVLGLSGMGKISFTPCLIHLITTSLLIGEVIKKKGISANPKLFIVSFNCNPCKPFKWDTLR